MLTLGGESLRFCNIGERARFIVRLTDNPALPKPLRESNAYLSKVPHDVLPPGFALYVFIGDDEGAERLIGDLPALILPVTYSYLGSGDILRVTPHRSGLRVLYRRSSAYNSILLTERCNNFCLMCSQPPKAADDSWIVDDVLQVIPLIDPDTHEIGFTGGEPTLLGAELIKILVACKNWLPRTAVHVLSNGRRFSDTAFAESYASVAHPDLMIGIPLYSDLSTVHDYVVQADGAFDDTVRGILNLKRLRQRVEIRVVLHKQTYERLAQLAEFIARNLCFVDHVALMGLEMTGFTRPNIGTLWIDPYDYQSELYAAVSHLAERRMKVSIYNHQLCVLDSRLWPYARKSISDWKNEYMPECSGCTMRSNCGGFFSSAKHRYSDHIRPFLSTDADALSST
jgi:His-Xaa-Ser system radical SAM maturase HxsC